MNQHFVPQFYFRQFTGGDPRIQLLLKAESRIIHNASIKGQCARHGFYGSDEIERFFSQLEKRHSKVLNNIIELAWTPRSNEVAVELFDWMWEAILFQRARTQLQINKLSPAWEALYLEMFKRYVEHSNDIDIKVPLLEHIECGNFRLIHDPIASTLMQISTLLESTLLISDLDFRILRNQTDSPFIFSDSPVVFHNTYCQNVTTRGVLGLQCPGLQIFWPLNNHTLLFLLDPEVYSMRPDMGLVIDICQRSDISQLNALQLHHSLRATYFSYTAASEYVSDLWFAHKRSIVEPRYSFNPSKRCLVLGEVVDDLLHLFEPQINIVLDLSFVHCVPVRASDFRFRHRSPDLVAEHRNHPRC